MKKHHVLFVCMGNICRSPTAEAVARKRAALAGLAAKIEFDSAGTHGYHVGDAPDPRTIAAGAARGYELASLRARIVETKDFARFNLVLAMDNQNYAQLARLCPDEFRGRLKRLLDFAPPGTIREVPDPYYGNTDGFNAVVDLVESAVDGLLRELA